MRFEAGNKVRLLEKWNERVPAGSTAVVLHPPYQNHWLRVKWDNGAPGNAYNPSKFELIPEVVEDTRSYLDAITQPL